MPEAPDPRVYFAAERTLLAWLRTGIGVMAFGFVVARFGLFLRLLPVEGGARAGHGVSPYLGAALVMLGAATSAAGAIQYRRFCRRLSPGELPSALAPFYGLVLAWALVATGLALALVLLT
jgi:putative membrane protein